MPTPLQITEHFQANQLPIVVFEDPILETDPKALFCAQADFLKINGRPVVILVDNHFNRYVKVGNKLYPASNSDLLRKSLRERICYIAYLSGIID